MKRQHGLLMLGLLVSLLGFRTASFGHGESGTPTAELKKLFPAASSFTSKTYKLSAAQTSSVQKKLGAAIEGHDAKGKVFIAVDKKGSSLGVAWFPEAHVKQGDIHLGVALDQSLQKVVKVIVPEHPESLEAKKGQVGIDDDEFLKQFKGKNANSMLMVGHDIKPVKGKEAACSAIAKGVKKTLVLVPVAFGK